MPIFPISRKFIGGLDRDSDARLIKEGDYYYALNMRNIASEGSTEGVIENIKGTTEVSYTFPGMTIGTNQVMYFDIISNKFLNNGGDGTMQGFVNAGGAQTDASSISCDIGISASIGQIDPPTNDFQFSGNFATSSGQNTAFSNFVTNYGTAILNTLGITVSVASNATDSALSPSSIGLGENGSYNFNDPFIYALKFESSASFMININGTTGTNTTVMENVNISSIFASYQSSVSSGDIFTVPSSMGWTLTSGSPVDTKGSANISSIDATEEDSGGLAFRCIGTYENTKTDKTYYFLASLNDAYKHLILEYDLQTSTIATV